MTTAAKPIVESVDYDVTLIIRLSTHIYFAPMERDSKITKFDAIDNAYGHMPADVLAQITDGFGGEFDVDFDAEATRDE